MERKYLTSTLKITIKILMYEIDIFKRQIERVKVAFDLEKLSTYTHVLLILLLIVFYL